MRQLTSSVTAAPERTQAIVIGASRYEDDQLRPLPSVVWNASGLAHLFTSWRFGLPRDHVHLLLDPEDAPEELLIGVSGIAKAAEDLLIIYYAGHGCPFGPTELQLAVYRTKPDHLRETSLPFSYIYDYVREARAQVKLIILDCCYAGLALDQLPFGPAASPDGTPAGTFLVASTAQSDPSFAPAGRTHTVFTGHLLDVLDGGLDNSSSTLGLSEVFYEVARRCRGEGVQEPQIRPALTESDLPFAYNARYPRDVSVEAAFIELYDTTDRWLKRLRRGTGLDVGGSLVGEVRRVVSWLHPYLEQRMIEVESEQSSDWPPEAIETCAAAADAIEDAVRRYHAASQLARRRRRDVLRSSGASLRRADDDNTVVLDARRALVDAITELRTGLRALGRRMAAD
jgi:caspase domain-containing protein